MPVTLMSDVPNPAVLAERIVNNRVCHFERRDTGVLPEILHILSPNGFTTLLASDSIPDILAVVVQQQRREHRDDPHWRNLHQEDFDDTDAGIAAMTGAVASKLSRTLVLFVRSERVSAGLLDLLRDGTSVHVVVCHE